jgi:hypothetical protein
MYFRASSKQMSGDGSSTFGMGKKIKLISRGNQGLGFLTAREPASLAE